MPKSAGPAPGLARAGWFAAACRTAQNRRPVLRGMPGMSTRAPALRPGRFPARRRRSSGARSARKQGRGKGTERPGRQNPPVRAMRFVVAGLLVPGLWQVRRASVRQCPERMQGPWFSVSCGIHGGQTPPPEPCIPAHPPPLAYEKSHTHLALKPFSEFDPRHGGCRDSRVCHSRAVAQARGTRGRTRGGRYGLAASPRHIQREFTCHFANF